MTVSPEVRELAAKAAAEIRRRGWHQGNLIPIPEEGNNDLATCPVCALGGVLAAEGRLAYLDVEYLSDEGWELADAFARRVLRFTPHPTFSRWDACDGVVDFNDASERTADDVLAVFDAIAGDADA